MSSDPTGWISHPVPAGNDGMHARALANAPSVATQRPEFKTVLGVKWPAPNAELTGRRRMDARPARRMMNHGAARAWWPAVGAPVERPVRPHLSKWQFRY